MKYALQLHDVSMSFAQKEVLSHIDLQVESGEIMGILGPSGAGKTTLIHIVSGRLKQCEGSVIFHRDLETSAYRFNAMMDTLGLYDRLSVYENMEFFADIYHRDRSDIDELLQRLGLQEATHTRCAKLSKGMRSRLSLARALLADARLLFLDEPTAGLDPLSTQMIHRLLLAEKAKGTTILLSTHHMEEAQSLCDHIALLYQGKIMEYGTPKQICMRYSCGTAIHLRLNNDMEYTFQSQRDGADQIYQWLKEERIASLHTQEASLESVFIQLTGRGLQDHAHHHIDMEETAKRDIAQ